MSDQLMNAFDPAYGGKRLRAAETPAVSSAVTDYWAVRSIMHMALMGICALERSRVLG